MILLAVSGGIDSIYMATKAPELFPGASFAVAHCNFHLRGDESDGDEDFVRRWCANRGMPLHVTHFDTLDYAAGHGVSVEMAARELRYAWFASLCADNGYEAVAVAHNANDNAETLLLNLLRGSGSRGMRGMAAESVLNTASGPVKILRPLLGTGREEITLRMQAAGHSWREDSTNAGSDCRRNLLRNKVFPLFREINPSFVRTLGADMAHFAMTDDIAEDYFAASGLDMEGGLDLVRLKSFRHWEYLLFRLLEPYALNGETFGKLVALLKSGRTISGKVFQSGTHNICIKLKKLYVEPKV